MSITLVILTAVVNSLWQSLSVAALVWLALRLIPRINAATRYAIWWATLGVVLILPFAPRLTAMLEPYSQPGAVKPVTTRLEMMPKPLSREPITVIITPGRGARWHLAVLSVWSAIVLWRLFQIGRSYFYLRGIKRRATISPIPLPPVGRRADLLISPDIVSPMAVGFLRPAVVLPESLLEELSYPEREHVLLHEAAHLARYDDWSNLAIRVLAGALALHPVAIWILRRIDREREMACDDWVVARTGAARSYAASLAHLFELLRARRSELLAPGVFGSASRLGDRIEMVLRRGRTSSARASATAVMSSAAILGCLMLAGSLAPRWIAFAQEPARPTFEVASVKPTPPARSGDQYGTYFRRLPGGRFSVENASLRMLIRWAYRVGMEPVPNGQISGGNWLKSDGRYDIEAKADDNDPRFKIAEAGGPRAQQALQDLMLQALLADRFKLAVHRETKETSGYALVVAKGGAKLKEATEVRPGDGSISVARGRLVGQKVPLSMLAGQLTRVLGRTVADETGIDGVVDFKLEWTPEDTPPDLSSGASIFAALQEQLGLRLEVRKERTEVIVVDHAEKPTAN
jgi:bla regulator protein blaR1